MCDKEIGEIGPPASIFSASNEDDSRTESDLISEKEPRQVYEHICTRSKRHAKKN